MPAGVRAEMVALVRESTPESLLDWLGSIVDHPERWVAILLDGEIDHEGSAADVRVAEVYGRSKRVYWDLPVFELDNEGAREAMRARSKLRDKLAPVIARLCSEHAQRCKFGDI